MEKYYFENKELGQHTCIVINRKYSNAEIIKQHKNQPQWVQDKVKEILYPKKEKSEEVD